MKHFNFVAANFSLNHCRNACEAHREACLAFAEGFALKRKMSCMKRIGKKKDAKAVKAKASFLNYEIYPLVTMLICRLVRIQVSVIAREEV